MSRITCNALRCVSGRHRILEAQQLIEALERLSINVTEDGEFTVDSGLAIFLHEDLADLNREALESGRPWMLAQAGRPRSLVWSDLPNGCYGHVGNAYCLSDSFRAGSTELLR